MEDVYRLREVSFNRVLTIPALNIPGGSLFLVSGPSGSGKTTFLKLLNNLISCDRGEILYRGRDILSIDPVKLRRKAVMVSHSPYIFPGTVYDNILLVFNFNRKEIVSQEKIEKMLSHFGLDGFLSRQTNKLSGGEKQRLGLVRALLLESETILLDEPTAALDEENSRTVYNYLNNWVQEGGRSVIMVSHDVSLAGRYTDGTMILDKGQIVELRQEGYARERTAVD
ncbi:MAG: ATP-binding cassette domain-containing protein [Bacillota bacterium]